MSHLAPGIFAPEHRVIPTDPTDSAHNGEPPAAVNEAAPLNAADCLRLLDALFRARGNHAGFVAVVVPDDPRDPMMIEYRGPSDPINATRRYHGQTLQEAITALAAGERMRA